MSRGLALYESVRRHCGEFQMDILCLDDATLKTLTAMNLPGCRLTPLAELEAADPALPKVKSDRTIAEYCFTMKSCLVKYLMARIPAGEILSYVDSDLYFFSNADPLFAEIEKGSIAIIPHRFSKEFAHKVQHGIYNAGWVSFRNDEKGNACNNRWREQCLEWCYDRIDEEHRQADQGYLDDWPERFPGVVVVQHLGANLAPWNVGQYAVRNDGGRVTVDGQPIVFYHFHAMRTVTERLFDSQLSKYAVNATPELNESVYQPYLDELQAIEQKLRGASGTITPQTRYTVVPRLPATNPAIPAEDAKVEEYFHKLLVQVEYDRTGKEAAILELLRRFKEKEAMVHWLNNRSLFSYISYWLSRTSRKIRIKLVEKIIDKYPIKPGVLRQYEPKEMQPEKFPAPTLPDDALPTIGIVTPSYMQGHFLERTMESILSQGYPKLSYIVQDGGSKDDSVAVIKRHEAKLTSWVSEPDKGQSDAVKRGFEKCHTDVMAWLNSDDVFMPGTLRYVGEYFARHPEVDAVYGHRVVIDEQDRDVGRWVLPPHDHETLKWLDYVPQETLFWRRALWDKVGGVDASFRFALDWDLLVKFEQAGANIVRLPYFLASFRIHDSQKTSAKINTHGMEEMARIRMGLHGRDITPRELAPYARKYLLKSVKTAWLLSMGIRA